MANLKTYDTMQLVGGILGGLGSLANAANSIYQTSRGAIPIPIGDLGTALGGALSSFGQNRREAFGREQSAQAINNMNLDPTTKSLASGFVYSGKTGDALKAIRDTGNTPDIRNYEYYVKQATAAGQAPEDYNTWFRTNKSLGGVNVSVSPQDKTTWALVKSQLDGLTKVKNDPTQWNMLPPDQQAAINGQINYLTGMANLPGLAPSGFGPAPQPNPQPAPQPPTNQGTTSYTYKNGKLVPK